MRILLNLKFVILSVGICLASLSFANEKGRPDRLGKVKAATPTCQALTDQCLICSDGQMRNEEGKQLSLSAWECVNKGKFLINIKQNNFASNIKGCMALSDFCGLCKDGHYIFTQNGAKIDSDLYECSTSPRINRVGSND